MTKTLTCRTCGKLFESEKTGPPFCSERCRLVDLGAWANQKYRIPAAPLSEQAAEKERAQDE